MQGSPSRKGSAWTWAVAALPLLFAACAPGPKRHQTHLMGPFDTITVLMAYSKSEKDFNKYADTVFARLEALHRMYDIFNEYNGLNNIRTINANAGIAPVEVAQEIIDMLLAAREAYALTGGVTNAAMGPVLRIWHDHRLRGIADPENASLPSMSALREAAERTSMDNVVIDKNMRTVFLREAGMSLDVGSIAKGYAAELALEAAREAGLGSALLSVGGHVVALGTPPGRGHWKVAVQNPEAALEGEPDTVDILSLTDATVSISGAYQRFYVVDGQAFGHVIDPKTLMPANSYKQVAVVHPKSWIADALSTALFVLPPDEGKALAAATGAEAFWIDRSGERFATPGYARLSSFVEQ